MKYINLSLFLLLITLVGCSQASNLPTEPAGDLDLEIDQVQETGPVQADSSLVIKISELEDTILFLEKKINLLEEKLDFYSNRTENILDIISDNNRMINELQGTKNKSITPVQAKPTPQAPKEQTPQAVYDQARNYYVKNDFTPAKEKFTEFINKFPNHELVINCRYWLAEIDYDQENYAEAIKKFQVISANSVNPEKAVDSLFKIALINKIIGNYDLALTQARAINTNYPNYIRINKVKALIKDLK